MAENEIRSRKALRELIALLEEVDERWLSPEWNLASADDIAQGTRALLHMLQGGLDSYFECEPSHPEFRRIVATNKKFTGDNADAIYYDAPVNPAFAYRVTGRIDGAAYTSFTVECGAADGSMGDRLGGVLNDSDMDVDEDGAYEIFLGGEQRERNWLPLPEGASRITTRHYFEEVEPAAADVRRHFALDIAAIEEGPAPATPSDASVAAGIERVIAFIRSRTLDQPPMADADTPAFVSKVPNVFPQPVTPGDHALAAADAAYSMAPFFLAPEQALVMTMRWPECRTGNVMLWNRHMQTFDFANRSVSLNRKQTQLEEDGSVRIVIAHENPGVPNWLDTEGRPFGLVFWRFMLPEGEIDTPHAEVVDVAQLRGNRDL